MRVSSGNRNAGLIAGAVAAVALAVTGCSSGDVGDAAAASATTAPAARPATGTPGPPATWTPAPVPSGTPEPADAPAPAQSGPAPAPDGGEQADRAQGGQELTRDQVTEQLKLLLGDPDDARWDGDTLRVTMSWGSADVEGMDGVCQGAQMILQQYKGTLTMDFPDGTTRTCAQ
ncbi:hypothetical protein [Tomitella cavernea]|uniref:META domain-containing protein n=1 Tax=Tomitella cavernea TaxID=1387982 RepID=A0ABP9CJI8_9ACTN|nr:hypothetical protein [Tomitella cavernea]